MLKVLTRSATYANVAVAGAAAAVVFTKTSAAPPVVVSGPVTQYMRHPSQTDGSLRALSQVEGTMRAKRPTEECLRHLS